MKEDVPREMVRMGTMEMEQVRMVKEGTTVMEEMEVKEINQMMVLEVPDLVLAVAVVAVPMMMEMVMEEMVPMEE